MPYLNLLEEQVPQGIMILPHWPTQVWWPQLLRMMIAISFVLPMHLDLLSLSHSPQTLHMSPACPLSGSPSRIEEFQRQPLGSSWPHGGMGQKTVQYLHHKMAKRL